MKEEIIVNENFVISKIYMIRNQKVMVEQDLAEKFDESSEEVNSSINLKVYLGLLVGIIVFISSRIRNLRGWYPLPSNLMMFGCSIRLSI